VGVDRRPIGARRGREGQPASVHPCSSQISRGGRLGTDLTFGGSSQLRV
jgi:hypothetical protein